MKYFVTKNRYGQPMTTDLDYFDDDAYLGVVSGYRIEDDEINVTFKNNEKNDEENDMSNVVEVVDGVFLSKLLVEKFLPKVEEFTGDVSYTVEFDWQLGHEQISGFYSLDEAKKYPDELVKKYSWSNVQNFVVYKVKSQATKI